MQFFIFFTTLSKHFYILLVNKFFHFLKFVVQSIEIESSFGAPKVTIKLISKLNTAQIYPHSKVSASISEK